jgi:hypothetical protein
LKNKHVFGLKIPLEWCDRVPIDSFSENAELAARLGQLCSEKAPYPPSREWFEENWRQASELARNCDGNKGLARAICAIYVHFSVEPILVRCKAEFGGPARQAMFLCIRESAKVQRLLTQACIWLCEQDVSELASLFENLPGQVPWHRTLRGARGVAAVAKALLANKVDVRLPDIEMDVDDKIDLIVPSFEPIGPVLVQVKAPRVDQRMSILMEVPICYGFPFMTFKYLREDTRQQLLALYQGVERVNKSRGTVFRPMFITVPGDHVHASFAQLVQTLEKRILRTG